MALEPLDTATSDPLNEYLRAGFKAAGDWLKAYEAKQGSPPTDQVIEECRLALMAKIHPKYHLVRGTTKDNASRLFAMLGKDGADKLSAFSKLTLICAIAAALNIPQHQP